MAIKSLELKDSDLSLSKASHLSRQSSSFAASSTAKKKHLLLNQYLQNPSRSSTVNQARSLGNLLDTLPQRPSSPRELGDLARLLQQKFVPSDTNGVTSDFHQRLFQKTTPRTKKNVFPQAAHALSGEQPSLFKNLSFIIIGIFGLGAIVFGLNQFIKNANLNFAASVASDALTQNPVTAPHILTFQGRVSNPDQLSVNDALIMRFQFFNTSGGNTPPPVGGEELWDSHLCLIVPNGQGVFSVNLGAGQGDDEDNFDCGADLGNIFAQNSSVWLQITIENEVLFPRQLIKSIPYALNSQTLQGYSASQSATANTVPVVDGYGNLNFGTNATHITNLGSLGLLSQSGDIYLLPGAGHIYIGNQNYQAHLQVTGDASISGQLTLGQGKQQAQLVTQNDQLTFKTQIAQDLWQDQMSLSQSATTSQQLSLNKTNLNFNFLASPELGQMTATDNGSHDHALAALPAPTSALTLNTLSQETGNLRNNSIYKYAYSFVATNGQESPLSPTVSYSSTLDQKQFLVTNVSTYPLSNVVSRRIYRTKADGDVFYLIQTLTDNLSTQFIDNLDDNQLHLLAPTASAHSSFYQYKVAFVTDTSQTNPSSQSVKLKLSGDNRQVLLNHLPLSKESIVARKIYRTLADGQTYYLLATLQDNTTTSYLDTTSDSDLAKNNPMPTSGGLLANNNLALQLEADGSITSQKTFTSAGRLETQHGDNQGLQLPTSSGAPLPSLGQKVGDIVYDTINQLIYVYNGSAFVSLQPATASSGQDSHCSGNQCRLTLDPEYAGATLTGETSNNLGNLSTGYDLINNQYRFNYYQWLSSQTTQLDSLYINVNFTLPSNFSSWQDNALTLDFLTSSINNNDNAVNLSLTKNGSDILVEKNSQVSSVANQWSSFALNSSPLLLTATELETLDAHGGDTLTLQITSQSKNNQAVKIGQINLNYLGQNQATTPAAIIWRQISGAISPVNSNQDVIFGGDSTASAKIAFLNLGSSIPTLYLKGNLFLESLIKRTFFDLAQDNSLAIRTLDHNQQATERVTVLANGNVGIGESTPGAKLAVGGDLALDGSLRFQPMTQAEAGACNSHNSGRIYYDSEDWQFYACQATDQNGAFAWVKLKQ